MDRGVRSSETCVSNSYLGVKKTVQGKHRCIRAVCQAISSVNYVQKARLGMKEYQDPAVHPVPLVLQ